MMLLIPCTPHSDFCSKSCWKAIFSQNTTIFSLIATEHIPKTAIMTTFGAAHVFQQLVDTVYHGLELAFVYINDILVDSEDEEMLRAISY